MRKIVFATVATALFSGGMVFASDTSALQWTYKGHAGPEQWGDLAPQYATCGTGKAQSPIDITTAQDRASAITTHYRETAVDVVNNGHTIQLNYAPGSTLVSAGVEYSLLQLHFHSPSEHTVNGKSFPVEMHLVHKSAEGGLAVVGVMFDEGAANADLGKIWSQMPDHAGGVLKSDMLVNAANLLPNERAFTGYDGSLTTPPCSEGVKWHVLDGSLQASAEQIAQFKAQIGENNRPTQPLNERLLHHTGD